MYVRYLTTRKTCVPNKLQGANILVDNKGCIKLADFGASKQVAELVHKLEFPLSLFYIVILFF